MRRAALFLWLAVLPGAAPAAPDLAHILRLERKVAAGGALETHLDAAGLDPITGNATPAFPAVPDLADGTRTEIDGGLAPLIVSMATGERLELPDGATAWMIRGGRVEGAQIGPVLDRPLIVWDDAHLDLTGHALELAPDTPAMILARGHLTLDGTRLTSGGSAPGFVLSLGTLNARNSVLDGLGRTDHSALAGLAAVRGNLAMVAHAPTLSGVTLTGGAALTLDGIPRARLDRIAIIGAQGHALTLRDSPGARLTRIDLRQAGGDGLRVLDSPCSMVRGLLTALHGGAGVHVKGGADLAQVLALGNGAEGIALEAAEVTARGLRLATNRRGLVGTGRLAAEDVGFPAQAPQILGGAMTRLTPALARRPLDAGLTLRTDPRPTPCPEGA